jgi:hypothetical protein
MDRRLRDLVADGLEYLGEIELGGLVSVGDPATFLGDSPDRVQIRVRPGKWFVLGRAWEENPDLLEEVLVVHEAALGQFYDLYDAAIPGGEADVLSGRVVALDGAIAGDAGVLKDAFEPEELPWIRDRGWVVFAVPGGPARVIRPVSDPVELLAVAMGPTRPQSAPSNPDTFDGGAP